MNLRQIVKKSFSFSEILFGKVGGYLFLAILNMAYN